MSRPRRSRSMKLTISFWKMILSTAARKVKSARSSKMTSHWKRHLMNSLEQGLRVCPLLILLLSKSEAGRKDPKTKGSLLWVKWRNKSSIQLLVSIWKFQKLQDKKWQWSKDSEPRSPSPKHPFKLKSQPFPPIHPPTHLKYLPK